MTEELQMSGRPTCAGVKLAVSGNNQWTMTIETRDSLAVATELGEGFVDRLVELGLMRKLQEPLIPLALKRTIEPMQWMCRPDNGQNMGFC